jgi:hypothetical protein
MPNICFSSPYHMFTHTIWKRTIFFLELDAPKSAEKYLNRI